MAFVYLLASTPYGTLYVGSTFDLPRRIYEHKAKVVPGFTAKYCVDRLLWCENHETLEGAIWEPRPLTLQTFTTGRFSEFLRAGSILSGEAS
jgi:putative endonuclease